MRRTPSVVLRERKQECMADAAAAGAALRPRLAAVDTSVGWHADRGAGVPSGWKNRALPGYSAATAAAAAAAESGVVALQLKPTCINVPTGGGAWWMNPEPRPLPVTYVDASMLPSYVHEAWYSSCAEHAAHMRRQGDLAYEEECRELTRGFRARASLPRADVAPVHARRSKYVIIGGIFAGIDLPWLGPDT